MSKKVYVSLPIDSIPGRDINERIAYANKVRESLSNFYDGVLTPFDGDWREGLSHSEYMRKSFKMMLQCDVVYFCKGWHASDGCSKELAVALWSGLEVVFEVDGCR